MRNCSEIWCETAGIGIDEINRRAIKFAVNGEFPTKCYLSPDLQAQLAKSLAFSQHYTIPTPGGNLGTFIMSINTSVGQLSVTTAHEFRNLLFIGCQEQFEAWVATGVDPIFWSDQERVKVDAEFEKHVLNKE